MTPTMGRHADRKRALRSAVHARKLCSGDVCLPRAVPRVCLTGAISGAMIGAVRVAIGAVREGNLRCADGEDRAA